MQKSPLYTAVIALAIAVVASPAFAGNPKGNGNNKGNHKSTRQSEASIEINVDINFGKAIFTDKERRIVRDYYRSSASDLPHGLAKRKALPPGLRKQLRKTGHLPPGLEKRHMPSELEHRLPKYYGPYERTIVGNDLIMLDPKTGLILDVMQEIFDVPVDETLQKVGARRVSY